MHRRYQSLIMNGQSERRFSSFSSCIQQSAAVLTHEEHVHPFQVFSHNTLILCLRQTLKCSVLSVTNSVAPAPSPTMQYTPTKTKPMGLLEIKQSSSALYMRKKNKFAVTFKVASAHVNFSLLLYEVVFYSASDEMQNSLRKII